MLFIVEVPDDDCAQTSCNRATIGARMREVLRESSPSNDAIAYPWGHEVDDWREFVFHHARVKAVPKGLTAALKNATHAANTS